MNQQVVVAIVALMLLLGLAAAVSPAEPFGLSAGSGIHLPTRAQAGYSHVNIFAVGASLHF